MVFSKSEEEHVTHVSTVLSGLRTNNLFAKASKCLFNVSSVEYLGYVVYSERLKMDKAKFQQILNWPPPRLFNHSLAFPISTAVSSRVIQRSVHSPVSSRKIPVSPSMRKLSVSFTTAPILSYFNPSIPTIVGTDASNYALGAVLSQVSDSGKHPISFNSRKLIPAELNYEIHDEVLLGIVWALKCWRAFLLSLSSPF
ncbi:hypothetical protein O181_106824 [Austropuccinia psidii MF-1]|uniref:Reverse transcriptase/retrotransposon-derived protein RNase H-like domain-containing protein n=1 Tax=Austropuccinia psidii MF-1 TaxID=1389203 RepID=A0A9Q3PMF8_9BASI|nr:hypothetical protein [Austropuccinia psidii MF-1]